MATKKKSLVPSPESAPEFRALVEERQKLLEQRERDGKEWGNLRARLDELGGMQSTVDSNSSAWQEIRAEQKRAHARILEIERANAESKARLRAIADELPRARQRAAAPIAADVAATAGPMVRSFLIARVEAEAASLVAASTVFPLADACSARRVPMRVAVPADLHRRRGELDTLRADAIAALEAGVLKPGDVPPQLRELWEV